MIGVERKLFAGRSLGFSSSSAGSMDGRRQATFSRATLSFVICASGEYFVEPLSPE